MKRGVITALLLTALSTAPVGAEPEFRIEYPNGVPRVEVSGDYRLSHYTVWRAAAADGPYGRLSDADVLCMGPCYADDYTAVGGRTYWYRFDLVTPDAGLVSLGPYLVVISADLARPLSVTLVPNPGHGPTQVTLFLAGRPGGAVLAEASVFDLEGRRLATLYHGALPSGPTRISWSGHTDDGRDLRSGLYLLRVATADGRYVVSRVIRTR
jgi:hypothetical protein